MVGGDYALMGKYDRGHSLVMMADYWKNLFFFWFCLVLSCEFMDQDEVKVKKKKKETKRKRGQLYPAILTSSLVLRGFTIYVPNDENLCLLDQRGKSIPRGSFLLAPQRSICFILSARELSRIIRYNNENITALKLVSVYSLFSTDEPIPT